MAYDNNDNKKNEKQNNEKQTTKGRTLGLVVATALAAAPGLGCSSDANSALTTDAGSHADTAVAMDSASQADATAETHVPEDASANDVYPDGVRG
jgi:hypothetical protein